MTKGFTEPETAEASDARPFPIVGIGASAGGFEALEQFFGKMPTTGDLALVVVSHLDPASKSLMVELLAKRTGMAVAQARDGASVEPGRVYVAPPGAELTIRRGRLRVVTDSPPHRPTLPVDGFLRSLARDRGEAAACIILSGTGTDGTLGLKAIKEHGGLTLVQDPASAKYDDMPRNAIATALVDAILPVEEMPKAIIEYARQRTNSAPGPLGLGRNGETGPHLSRILLLLRKQTGHDFTHYKQKTIIRRIVRRMQILSIEHDEDYVALLRGSPEEIQLLFKELLIGVTHFFRDPEAFVALGAEILPRLCSESPDSRAVRIWVPGCATGEEAYSIAMLLDEGASSRGTSLDVQIFATDIDESALAFARAGIYPDSIAADVNSERLERFFVHEGDTCRVVKRIREMIVFSAHNLIRDPPFSKLDLISCRNVLIYLDQELQKRLMPLLHYALVPGGTLFLGPSETIGNTTYLFREAAKKHRVFRRETTITRPRVHFPLFPLVSPVRSERGRIAAPPPLAEVDLTRVVDRMLLESYAPASVVIDEKLDIVLFYGHTGNYLEAPPGAPNVNIMRMARWGLRLKLRAAIHLASKQKRKVIETGVRVKNHDSFHEIDLVVQPIDDGAVASTFLLISFQDAAPRVSTVEQVDDPSAGSSEDPILLHLENELKNTQEYLQASVEELETANEELKSSNEELLSMNEELQSTNEELETAKEESQSVNEELETVNAELNRKVEELDCLNNDMANLLSSLQIATIFLGNDLRIKSFTPAITEIFHLIQSDIGRPITDIAQRIAYDQMAVDVQVVLRNLSVIERQVQTENGDWCKLEIRPYRTLDNVIDGVVITFVDITGLKRTEQALREGAEQHRSWIERAPVCIHELDGKGRFLTLNPAGFRLLGLDPETGVPGAAYLDVVALEERDRIAALLQEVYEGQSSEFEFLASFERDDSRVLRSHFNPVYEAGGSVVKLIGCTFDISDLKQAEAALKRANEELLSQFEKTQ